MLTAILITAALVIAVGALALCRAAGKENRGPDLGWAKEYKKGKNIAIWCDNNCAMCAEKTFCKLKD